MEREFIQVSSSIRVQLELELELENSIFLSSIKNILYYFNQVS